MRILFLLLVALVAVGCGGGKRSLSAWLDCRENVLRVATALETYSADHRGRYPAALSDLVPKYLEAVPTCPAAGTVTLAYVAGAAPDRHALYCAGTWHRPLQGPNEPAFDSLVGLRGRARDAGHDLASCRSRLERAGRALQAYRLSHQGALPPEADEGAVLGAGVGLVGAGPVGAGLVGVGLGEPEADAFMLVATLEGGVLRVACGGATHVHEGLAPFQPEWRPDVGVTARRLPDPPAAPERTLTPVLLAVGGLVVALTLVGWRRRRRAA